MGNLSLTNVVNVSVSAPGTGVGSNNTSNLALFTRETPASSFGTLGYNIYVSPAQVGLDFGTNSTTYAMANAVFSQQPNILANNGYLVIIPMLTSETLDAAITRTSGLVQYFGVMIEEVTSQVNMLAAAAVIQALTKIAFFVSYTAADVIEGGKLDLLRSGGFTQSRGLFYGDTLATALVMQAAYAGRALSTNFTGSNTTQTMHLKDLKGVQPDPSMTQSLLVLCQAAGADTYVSLQGVPKTFTSGKNGFFDDVYNLLWFTSAIKVAGFNALATLSTKMPQTEDGLRVLKAAYRVVCEQALANQYAAPGEWTSPTTFGSQADFHSNINQRGYFIYSLPISQQDAATRATRAAPLIQIAVKEAGAIHSTGTIININP